MRTKKGVLNFISSYVFYFILAILGFIKVKVFISVLGENLYALNQLYISLFSYLSLAEAGIGVAFTYRLYKMLSEKNYNGINAIYSGTKEILKNIGIFMIFVAIILAFFVPLFIKDNTFPNYYILITFLIFVIKNVIDYFMYVPRLIIQADQNMYKINSHIYSFRIFEVIIEIVLLYLGVNYLIILIPGIFIRIIQNYFVNKKVFKLYPWLKLVKDKDYSNKQDVKHMLVHRLVGLVNNNIDIVIISTFIGSKAVAIYASYNYLVKFAYDTTSQIFNSLKDGLGNLLNEEKSNKIKEVINEFLSLFSFVASIVVITFYFILNDFIGIWVGEIYVANKMILILFLIIVYYHINIKSLTIIRTALGLFKETKIMAGIEAGLNLTISLILVQYLGLKGVLIGTIIAFLITSFWYYPYIIYNKLFKENISKYMIKILVDLSIVILIIIILSPIYNHINFTYFSSKILNWIITSAIIGLIVTAILTMIYYLFYPEFRRILLRIRKLLRNIKNKVKN